MCIFLALTLAWLPAMVALDHPDDDHLHVICVVPDKASGSSGPPYRVPRSLIFCHDGQPLDFCEGAHAQLLVSDGLGYKFQVWVKVIIKKVWKEGFALVTICSEGRDVIAQKVIAFAVHWLPVTCFPRTAFAAIPWCRCMRTSLFHQLFQKLCPLFVIRASAPPAAEAGANPLPRDFQVASETLFQTFYQKRRILNQH